MVEDVEGVRLQRESDALPNVDRLAKTHIKIINARLAQVVPRRVSIRPQWWLGEAGRIETLKLRRQIAMNLAARHIIRMLELGIVQALDICPGNGERETSLEGGDAANLPAANRQVFRPVDSAPNFLPRPNGS